MIVLVLAGFPLKAQTKIDSLTSNKPDTVKFVMQKSPTGAMLRSAILPGWGQFYNESYWKIPIVWGFLGYFAYKALDNNRLYKDYEGYAAADPSSRNIQIRDYYRDTRDTYFVYMALTYLINIVDSYVDAHLFDFNVSEMNNVKNYTLRIKLGL